MPTDERLLEAVRGSPAMKHALRRMRMAWQWEEAAALARSQEERWSLLKAADRERSEAEIDVADAVAEIVAAITDR